MCLLLPNSHPHHLALYPVPTNEAMTTKSQRYNCFIRNGGNVTSLRAYPEAKFSSHTLDICSSGFVTRSEEILTTAKSHKKKRDGCKACNGVNRYLGLPVGLFRKDIWIVCLFFGATAPQWARVFSFTSFLYHTQRRTTVGKTPLDE